MPSATANISRIQLKLQELFKKYTAALKEIEQQQKSILQLRQQEDLNQKKIKALEEQQYMLKAAAGKMTEPDKKQFEQVITRYVREIDKCIDLLSE